jgi:hypothetical protein
VQRLDRYVIALKMLYATKVVGIRVAERPQREFEMTSYALSVVSANDVFRLQKLSVVTQSTLY